MPKRMGLSDNNQRNLPLVRMHIVIPVLEKGICSSHHDDDHTVTTQSTLSALTWCSMSSQSSSETVKYTSLDPDRALLWEWKHLEQAVVDSRIKTKRCVIKSQTMRDKIKLFGN